MEDQDIQMKKTTIKWVLVAILVLALCIISYFVGHQNVEVVDKYEYTQSEKEDSLEIESLINMRVVDSIDGELKIMRTAIDGTVFLSDEELENTIKESYDELHTKTYNHIDSLFVHKYDSAVTARRLNYNGQR